MSTPPPPVAGDDGGLQARELRLGYDQRVVVPDLDLQLTPGTITAVVGANGSGKSTLLRALARLLPPRSGCVLLDGAAIDRLPTRTVATRVGLLPQSPTNPDAVTVEDLVARGRYPHQSWLRQWSTSDERAVAGALELAGLADLRQRRVDTLSGGQRQRVWIALTLAQQTDILLLDEPTTYLDLAYQVEVLDLLAELNEQAGRTIVMVLHDINHAARYAHRIVALKDGRIVADGRPHDVVTAETLSAVFGLPCTVLVDPVTDTPLCIPVGRRSRPRTDR